MAKELLNESDYQHMLELSQVEPVVLFKLSPICPTSFQAEYEMESLEKKDSNLKLFRVNVVAQRPLSRMIAEKCGVQHESPQVILFSKGEVLWDASHYEISRDRVLKAIDAHS